MIALFKHWLFALETVRPLRFSGTVCRASAFLDLHDRVSHHRLRIIIIHAACWRSLDSICHRPVGTVVVTSEVGGKSLLRDSTRFDLPSGRRLFGHRPCSCFFFGRETEGEGSERLFFPNCTRCVVLFYQMALYSYLSEY